MIPALTLLALHACDTTPEEKPFNHFVDVYQPILTVNAGDTPARGPRLQVLAHAELVGACRELPELRADVNGVQLKRLHGKVEDGNYVYDRDCNVYEFEGDAAWIAALPPSELQVITVTDGVTSVSATTRNLFAKPALTIENPAVAAGSEVVLKWAPGGDVVNEKAPVSVSLKAADLDAIVLTDVKATAESITFTLPAELKGEVSVDLRGTRAFNPPVVACTSLSKCEVSRAFVIEPVTLNVK